MTEQVFVTNNSGQRLVAEFDYRDIEFPAGESVEISVRAARHIFGFGAENKEPYLARLGLIRLHSELEQGLEKLAQFEITSELPQKDRSLPSAVGVVPLRVERHARGKSTARAA
jgi:hypothetical protein